jgi:acetolactate synthase I/II/III large subunit
MKASDLFVRCLEAEGVDHVFAVPGEENLDLLESLRTSSIRLVVTRHEQAAGFMAATWGRLTGTPGVCLSTLGPGATNLVTPAAFAQLGAMPLVMITGQKPIRSSKQGAFQIIDVVGMMAPITKYTRQVVGAGYIPSRVREAFRRAREERPGATHLELPEDILREEVEGEPLRPVDPRRPVADDEAIRRAVERLRGARRPLLVIASGANRTLTCHRLGEFVDRFRIPFITTQMGKGVVDERNPCYVGTAALSSDDFVHRAVDEADLIVNVGHNVVEKPPFLMEKGGTEVVHIDFGSAEVDPVYFPQVEVVGDIAESIRRIMEELGQRPDGWDLAHVEPIRRAARDHVRERSEDAAFPLRPLRVVADLREALPEDGVVCLDNGMYKIWFARSFPTFHPNSLLLDNALATMGAGLPTAMAAKMAHPERPVVAVCGDGGFMMNSQELETAVRLELDLVVLVLRDDGYGMIRWKQKDFGFPDFGLDYGNPDFVRYAEAHGARGHRVERAEDFGPLVARCLGEGGVHLVDVPVDYGRDNHILNEEIPERVRALG